MGSTCSRACEVSPSPKPSIAFWYWYQESRVDQIGVWLPLNAAQFLS